MTRVNHAVLAETGSHPSDSTFHIACEDLKPARKYVVYGGDEAFGLIQDITAIPLLALMDEISELQK